MRKTSGAEILGCALLLGAGVLLCRPGVAAKQVAASRVRFTDIGQQAGLGVQVVNGGERTKKYIFESTGSGVAFLDYDRDGYPDIFVVNGSRLEGFPAGKSPSNYLFHNNRDGTFTDVTAAAGLTSSGWGQGVCVGDYDNDGFDDLFVTYFGRPNVLYHNNGDGTFADVTRQAGLESSGRNWSTGCAFLDYDRDGKLDLFVAGYVDFDIASAPLPGSSPNCLWKGVAVFCGPRGLPPAKPHLYHNQGHGAFADVSAQAGILKANACYGFGVLTGDFQNRDWPDIYVACDSTPSLFFRNNGNGTFTERGVEAGVAFSEDGLEQAGMGVSAADYDGDGFLDILKTNFDEDVPDLYRNEGDGTFSLRTFDAKLGSNLRYLGWGGGFFDYDNDGWPDIFIANGHVYPELESHHHPESPYRQRNLLYHNQADGTFEDVTSLAGEGLELRRSGRGVAFADFDNDGDLDAVINNQNDPPTLLRNDGGNRNHWLSIRTVGAQSNRDGIGARITILAGGHRQMAEVRSGGSYLSQNDLRVHFGLGQATKADRVEICWPSSMTDKIENVPADRFLVIQEGKGVVGRK
jgi:enediyne biosynthesis protein E4